MHARAYTPEDLELLSRAFRNTLVMLHFTHQRDRWPWCGIDSEVTADIARGLLDAFDSGERDLVSLQGKAVCFLIVQRGGLRPVTRTAWR
jgi:hypothetical protein